MALTYRRRTLAMCRIEPAALRSVCSSSLLLASALRLNELVQHLAGYSPFECIGISWFRFRLLCLLVRAAARLLLLSAGPVRAPLACVLHGHTTCVRPTCVRPTCVRPTCVRPHSVHGVGTMTVGIVEPSVGDAVRRHHGRPHEYYSVLNGVGDAVKLADSRPHDIASSSSVNTQPSAR